MKIYFQKGERAGESVEYPPPGVFIGRESDNDIQLLVEGVSQYHAKIMLEDDKWMIYDLDSSNGTRVNGKSVKEPIPLKSGDMIYIAKEALKVEFEDKDQDYNKDDKKDILDKEKEDAVKIRSPEEAKKTLPPEEETIKPAATKIDIGKIPKKSKEQKALEREHRRLLAEAIREKKKRLVIIAIIVFFVGNGLVFWWWFSRWLEHQ